MLEIKTRRKPLTGQYLMYREGLVWYNLELKADQDSTVIYQFTKDNNSYSLILEKDKLRARIELLKSNSQGEKALSNLQDIKLDQFWSEVIANYIENFKTISLRIKQDNLLYPNSILSNGIMWDIHDFYEQENNKQRAIEIAELNNTYRDIWREIPVEDIEE